MSINSEIGDKENTSEPRTHAIDIGALERSNDNLGIERETISLEVKNLNLHYGEAQALKNINIQIPQNRVTAFIGPSGCGKSTLLR